MSQATPAPSSSEAAASFSGPACCRCQKTPAQLCAQCRQVAYCSKDCQAADWKAGHKTKCKQLKQAADHARNEATNSAFLARLAAAPTTARTTCPVDLKAVTRLAACDRCSVPCCSAGCFMSHDCDFWLSVFRSMPKETIAAEDRLRPDDELTAKSILDQIRQVGRDSGPWAARCDQIFKSICSDVYEALHLVVVTARFIAPVFPPRDRGSCWWVTGPDAKTIVSAVLTAFSSLGQILNGINTMFVSCVVAATPLDYTANPKLIPRLDDSKLPSAIHPSRLLHRLLVHFIFFFRHVPRAHLPQHMRDRLSVSLDEFGLIPETRPRPADAESALLSHVYSMQRDPSGKPTLVMNMNREPLPHVANRCAGTTAVLGQGMMMSMIVAQGEIVREPGLWIFTEVNFENVPMCQVHAVSGYAGRVGLNFRESSKMIHYLDRATLAKLMHTPPFPRQLLEAELRTRQKDEYSGLAELLQTCLGEDWPPTGRDAIFVPTPRRGMETELTELLTLEELIREAQAGDAHSKEIVDHVEGECAMPIEQVLAEHARRLGTMLTAQAEQLRAHAESNKQPSAVTADSASSSSSSAGAAASSGASSAATPASASSTSSASTSSSAASPPMHTPLWSWTQGAQYSDVDSLRDAGRNKYSTIVKAAVRLLHQLKSVRVKQTAAAAAAGAGSAGSASSAAGSKVVFQFASGKPVPLVVPQDSSDSRGSVKAPSFCCRLFGVFSDAALEPFGTPARIEEVATAGAAAAAGGPKSTQR